MSWLMLLSSLVYVVVGVVLSWRAGLVTKNLHKDSRLPVINRSSRLEAPTE